MSKPVLYEFAGSVWAKAPQIAITEGGNKPGDYDVKSVNLAEGANFEPSYLKINEHGTVPTLVVDGDKYIESTTAVQEILKRAPNPPKHDSHTDHELHKLVKAVHSPAHDPNEMLLLPVDDADRAEKAKGVPAAFLGGRQKALDRLAPSAPSEFSAFLKEKQKGNKELLEFIIGTPDEAAKTKLYQKASDEWKSAGEFIRGELTHILRKTPGKFLGGADRPGEADIHVITWLARTVTNAGAEPGSSSDVAIAAVQKKTGGQEINPVVSEYWDSWISRPSFKDNNVH